MKSSPASYSNVVCPRCGASVGKPCIFQKGEFRMFHKERVLQVSVETKKVFVPPDTPFPGSTPSGACRAGSHRNCSGKGRAKHGLPGEKCTCTCHKKEKSRQ